MKKVIFFSLLINFVCKSSHIVGGEFALTHIAGNQYRISFYIFQDAINANAGTIDSEAEITFFDKATNIKLDSMALPLLDIDTLASEDGVCSFVKFKTSRLTYSAILNLTSPKYAGSQGYYVAWDRCCRSAGTTNIRNSGAVGTVIYAEFPPITTINSSPIFSVPIKTVYGCVGIPQSFSFAATDSDGDNLEYSLEAPLQGSNSQISPKGYPQSAPYLDVPLQSAFGVSNFVPGNPASQINSLTGILTITPTMTGFYGIKVKVKEYRNGLYIGEVNREYQLVISSCFAENTKPKLLFLNPNTWQYVSTLTSSILFDGETNYCLTFAGIDTLKYQRLSMQGTSLNFGDRFNSQTLNPVSHIVKNKIDTAFFQYCIPKCTYNSDSLYKLSFTLKNENNCSFPNYSEINLTFKSTIPAVERPIIDFSIPNNTSFSVGETINLVVTVTSKNGNWLKYSTNTSSPIPKLRGVGKSQVITTTSYMVTCNDLEQSLFFYSFRAMDSTCVNQNVGSKSLTLNLTKNGAKPTIKIWDESQSRYVSSITGLNFEKNKPFCVSIAGIETVIGQNVTLETNPINFSSLLNSFVNPTNKVIQFSNDTAKFTYCLASCLPNLSDNYQINFKLKSQNTCSLGTSAGILLSLNNISKSNPTLMVFDASKNEFSNTISSQNFDGRKDFCLSFTGSDVFVGQNIALELTQKSSPNFTNFSLEPRSYTLKFANEKKDFQFCLAKCFPNNGKSIELNFYLKSNGNCLSGTSNGINLTLNPNLIENKKPIINTNLNNIDSLNYYINQPINFEIKVLSPDSNWVKLRTQNNSNLPNLFSKKINQTEENFSYTFNCPAHLQSPFIYRIIATDSSCLAQYSDTLVLKFNIKDSTFQKNFFIANIITPNNDNYNDFFEIKKLPNNTCDEQFEKLEIYNRWGSIIHQTTEKNPTWQAQNSPDGLYFYVIQYTKSRFNGWVQVLR